MLGRRRMFVVGVLGFTAGSALACLAPTIERADRGPGRAGRRRGDDGAAGAVVAAGALRPARARPDVRRDRRRLRALRGDRAAPRRLAGEQRRVRHRLAQHLPDQPAGRAGAGGPGLPVRAGHPVRAPGPARPGRAGALHVRPARRRLRPRRGTSAGLGVVDLGDGRHGRRHCSSRSSSSSGAASVVPARRCCRCGCSPTAASPPVWSRRRRSRAPWPASRWCSRSTCRPGSAGRRCTPA